jgi:hypothetical protein
MRAAASSASRPVSALAARSSRISAAAREVGFLGFGFYPRSGFMHVDLGPARQWGERFPVRAIAFAEDTPPVREVLADSRTMKGGGAAGVATLGACITLVVRFGSSNVPKMCIRHDFDSFAWNR